MKQLVVEALTDEALIQAIESAQWRVRLYAPGVSQKVAEALIKKHNKFCQNYQQDSKRFHLFSKVREFDFCVGLDVSENAIKMGYGEATAVQSLWDEDTKHGEESAKRWFYFAPEIRVGLLVADDVSMLFSPLARLMEAQATLAARGPNGITLAYELLLTEEYQQQLKPIAQRLVSHDDIKELTQIPTETREQLEQKIKDLQTEKKNLEEQIETAVSDYKKKIENPPLCGLDFSVKKFNLELLTLKTPQALVKKMVAQSKKNELEMRIRFSKEEAEEIFEGDFLFEGATWTFETILQTIEACREDYLYDVLYKEQDFVNSNKSVTRHQKVLLKQHEAIFREKIVKLRRILWNLKDKVENKLEQKIEEKIRRLFDIDFSKEEQNLFKRYPELKKSLKKFDPEIDVREHFLKPDILTNTTFQIGLFDALAKKHLKPEPGYDAQKDEGWNILVANGVEDKKCIGPREKKDYEEKDKLEVIATLYEKHNKGLFPKTDVTKE